jgi:hypothetical protein
VEMRRKRKAIKELNKTGSDTYSNRKYHTRK